MKIIKLSLMSFLIFALIACTTTTNPLSNELDEEQSDYNNTILFDTSGQNENG